MFCASQAATAVCMSSEKHITTISGRAIDRYNPIIIHGSRRSISSSRSGTLKKTQETSTNGSSDTRSGTKSALGYPKSSNDREKRASDWADGVRKSSASLVDAVRKSSSCIRPSAYFTPPGSQRYLLDDNDKQPHSESALALAPPDKVKVTQSSSKNDAPLFVPKSDTDSNQIVVVSVSLHCKGCAGKVKKHISKMQGVTSFNIDFDAKKVTVVGNVTQLEVLASISKVRTAQVLLPPEKTSAATLSPPPRTNIEMPAKR